jgi:hypothetical protein
MRTITLNIPDNVARLLDELATKFQQTPEQIAEQILVTHERVVNPPPQTPEQDRKFRAALAATLEKNAELYRRLAASDSEG